jgi:hypothetical protein
MAPSRTIPRSIKNKSLGRFKKDHKRVNMTFNIKEFVGVVNKVGLAKNNLFSTLITPPTSINLQIKRDLPFICRSASIPGMEISTIDIKPQGWGRTEKRASDFMKANLALTFMVDSNFAVKQFFHRWIQTVVNYNALGGPLSQDSSKKLPYEFDYKDNYSGVVQVEVYSENKDTKGNVKVYKYQFDKAFPVSIGSVETAWENQAEIMLLTVAFAYDHISVSGMNATMTSTRSTNPVFGSTATGGQDSGAFSGAISLGLEQTLLNTNLPIDIQDSINLISAPLNRALYN